MIALLIVYISLPAFNILVEKKLVFDLTNPVLWAGLPLIGLVCGVLAGSYPSLYLSSFNPTTVFRGINAAKDSVITYIRKGLVVTQFAVSIVLIISTIIVYKQIQHTKDRQLGYNKDRIIYTPLRDMSRHLAAIRQELLATGVVENIGVSSSRVMTISSSSGNFTWPGKSANKEVLISTDNISPGYLSTMNMQLVSGRDFYPDAVRDSSSIIINETFARIIGKKDPVGQIIRQQDSLPLHIVGVVKDFVFNNMYGKPEPLILYCDPSDSYTMLMRIKDEENLSRATAKIESVIKKYSPAYPFEYTFLNDDFNNLFKSEMLVGKLSQLFAMLTILISCLGLFGLAAYTAERRTKEIGIRKVLGASIAGIMQLMTIDFLKLIGIAILIAIPIAWWAMHNWLNSYAYKTSLNGWIFLLAGAMAIFIALITISFHALKAALANPVKSLKTE
jgi:putative ABC transport system permease protein